MKILIVEDEVFSQEELSRLIKLKFPRFEIAGLTKSIDETIDFLSNNSVDIIFMDIELSDGNSLDIFDQIEIKTPVIFTTAYEQYALKAFQTSGVSYLLKPIKADELVKAVEKCPVTTNNNTNNQKIINELSSHLSKGYKTRILTKSGDQISSINMADVAYFIAEDRTCFAITQANKRYFIDYTLDTLEKTLDPNIYFRITRNCIASISSIKQISKFFNSRLKIKLEPHFADGDLLVSRAKVSEFMKWLDGDM